MIHAGDRYPPVARTFSDGLRVQVHCDRRIVRSAVEGAVAVGCAWMEFQRAGADE